MRCFMSKSDHDFVNMSQEYELKDWLYRNGFSKKEENFTKLKNIINVKIKENDTSKNITWATLDNSLKNHKTWFSGLAAIGG